ncbi:hemin uptake protein hemP [Phaeovulum vinaykumarii]|uniref:Hemin uptake protein hemP n=1 Tax=Phaeovulum vinaykumarii TaxID=407234 RepID=A0A1N7N5U4_9RHOB|nr:Hemin uptake protein hemP [Phaeovulum vinaykumarii]SOC20126.1 hemin uptake protein hemP [Phaeovulum vinaykumarii]
MRDDNGQTRPRLGLRMPDGAADATLGRHMQPDTCPKVPRHDARALTCGAGLAHILLDDVAYTLRITRNGKLILTK